MTDIIGAVMPRTHVVAWTSRITGVGGRDMTRRTPADAKRECARLNEEHPDLVHTVEIAE